MAGIRPITPSEAVRLRCKSLAAEARSRGMMGARDDQIWYDDLERFFTDLEHYIATLERRLL